MVVGLPVLVLPCPVLGPAFPVGELAADVRGEEQKVVEHSHNGNQRVQEVPRQQILEDRQGKVGRVNPGQPLGLDRDDEEEQELQVGIEGGKGEEHGHIDIVHGRGAHQNVQQNAEEIENGELVGTPLPLQALPMK